MAARHPQMQMLTASRLRDGEAVWWAKGSWVDELVQGEIFSDEPTAGAALKAAEADVQSNVVVNPYLFEVHVTDGRPKPVKEKEIIRSAGPSIHAGLGKQARHV